MQSVFMPFGSLSCIYANFNKDLWKADMGKMC